MGLTIRWNGKKSEEELRGRRNEALDLVFASDFVRDCITGGLAGRVKALEMDAGALRYNCDRVIVTADAKVCSLINGIIDAGGTRKDKVIAFPPSYESDRYIAVLEEIREKDAGLLCTENEAPAVLAARTTFEKAIGRKYDPEQAAARMKSVQADDALFYCLMVEGMDMDAFLKGASAMVSDMGWDAGYDEIAVSLAEKKELRIEVWDRALVELANWMGRELASSEIRTEVVMMPDEDMDKAGDKLVIQLADLSGEEDIMLTAFPGAPPEGSLNQMKKDAVMERGKNGALLLPEDTSMESLGRIWVFTRMISAITDYFSE